MLVNGYVRGVAYKYIFSEFLNISRWIDASNLTCVLYSILPKVWMALATLQGKEKVIFETLNFCYKGGDIGECRIKQIHNYKTLMMCRSSWRSYTVI